MRLKGISCLLVLTIGILLLGSQGVKAETSYESLKGLFNKEVTSVEKSDSSLLQKQKLSDIEKALEAGRKSSVDSSKSIRANVTVGSDYTTIYEVEPNDTLSQANFLNLDEIAAGILDYADIDTYRLNINKSGPLVIAGLMEEGVPSELGFLLFDKNDNYLDPVDYYQEGKQLLELYDVTPGTYYIKAFNMNDYYGDVYALVATMDLDEGDTTPPPAPIVDPVDEGDTVLTGIAEAGSTIEVLVNGMTVGSATTEANGRFTVSVPSYSAGTVLNVTATDSAGNRSSISSMTVVGPTFTGWAVANGIYYHYTNGAKNTGWYFEKGKYYYLAPGSGAMKTGWLSWGNKWYFLDKKSGVMRTGWVKSGTAWYYLNSAGDMKIGWHYYGRNWYYLGNDGAMKTGWVKAGGKWYYFYNSGIMAYSTKIGSYRLGADGAWIR